MKHVMVHIFQEETDEDNSSSRKVLKSIKLISTQTSWEYEEHTYLLQMEEAQNQLHFAPFYVGTS